MLLRYLLAALAAFVLLTASLIPDDAYARGGRGGGGGFRGGGGGFHGGGFRGGGGGMHAGGVHGGGYRGRTHPSHPIAGRPGRPGYGITPVVRATRSRAEGIIADTAGRQWEPQRSVPRPMALMVLTTTVTMRTAIGSVPISISIETPSTCRRRLAGAGDAVALADQTANTGGCAFLHPGPAIGIVRPKGSCFSSKAMSRSE